MRQPRIKLDDQNTWHHCYNRVVGISADRPFGKSEKEQFVRILKRVSRLYTVRVVAYQVMSNHFHLLLYAPVEMPDTEVTCRRFTRFHYGKRSLRPDSAACRAWQGRCRDVSWFMRHLQHLYTAWYNRTRTCQRRGSLWAGRFKNTILEDGLAVWSCWKYIENNPVRAHMVENAADYRFSSYGAWCQSGRHPFEHDIKNILLPLMEMLFGLRTVASIRVCMKQGLDAKGAQEELRSGFSLTVQRRVRHWTDGLVIGSDLFVREVMRRYQLAPVVARHRLARTDDSDTLSAWRRIRLIVPG